MTSSTRMYSAAARSSARRPGMSHAVAFRARVADTGVQGVDIVKIDEHDRIATLTVMLRPVAALNALTNAVKTHFSGGPPGPAAGEPMSASKEQ